MSVHESTGLRWSTTLSRVGFSLLTTGAVVGILLWITDAPTILKTLRNVEPSSLLAGVILYALNSLFRALRFKWLIISRPTRMGSLFLVVSALSLFNQILPFRSGELTYLYLIKKSHGVEPRESLASLIIARFLDLIIVCCFFVLAWIAIVLSSDSAQARLKLLLPAGLALLLLILSVFGLVRYGAIVLDILRNKFAKKRGIQSKLANRVLRFFSQVLDTFHFYDSFSLLTRVGALSIGVWIASSAMIVVLIRGLGYDIESQVVFFAAVASAFTSVLPINSLGNWGTLELGWAGVLIAHGVSPEDAVTSGVSMHLIAMAYAIVFGIVGWLGVQRRYKHSKHDQIEQA